MLAVPPVIPPPVIPPRWGGPQVSGSGFPGESGPVRPRWRSVAFLMWAGFYPLVVGLLGAWIQRDAPSRGPALPSTVSGLIAVCVESVVVFALIFGVGVWLGRPTRQELFWSPMRLWDWWWGALWSIGVRLGAVVMVYGALIPFWLAKNLRSRAVGTDAAQPSMEERFEQFRPKLESLLEFEALGDPVYLLFAVTLLSFVTAGLREELWRAGFMSALRDLLPRSWWIPRPRVASEGWWRWQTRRLGPTVLVAFLASVVFGLGHLPQGPGGVVLTAVVGFILAMVMIGHRSLWAAVIAHGFFDASTFVLLAVIVRNKETIQRIAPDLLKQLGM
jgi:membrane protease YdiL (CAAX protease family)